MRSILCVLTAAALLMASGCHLNSVACNSCSGGKLGGKSPAPAGVSQVPQGYPTQRFVPADPPAPTYAYPYYTVRAPRDFLMPNPPSIGY